MPPDHHAVCVLVVHLAGNVRGMKLYQRNSLGHVRLRGLSNARNHRSPLGYWSLFAIAIPPVIRGNLDDVRCTSDDVDTENLFADGQVMSLMPSVSARIGLEECSNVLAGDSDNFFHDCLHWVGLPVCYRVYK